MAMSSHSEASSCAQEALDLVPNHHQAVMTMARVSQAQGSLGRASSYLLHAIQARPYSIPALISLSECRLRLGDDSGALEALHTAVDTENLVGGAAWQALTKCYDVLGHHAKASEMKVREGIGNTGTLRKRAVELLKSL